jgi:hypothetical protein
MAGLNKPYQFAKVGLKFQNAKEKLSFLGHLQ